jgi:hypothetical protein
MSTQFVVGKTYYTRSIADYDTVFSFRILERTAKTVTVRVHGKSTRRGVLRHGGIEQFKPFGSYSMCPIVTADKDDRSTFDYANVSVSEYAQS